MTAMLEGNNEDKMEAIDSLREEYEEHCRNAVEQTKRFVNFIKLGSLCYLSVRYKCLLIKNNRSIY